MRLSLSQYSFLYRLSETFYITSLYINFISPAGSTIQIQILSVAYDTKYILKYKKNYK